VGDKIFVGKSGRTNEEGIKQLTQAFEPLGAQVFAVPISKLLHLRSAIGALPN
jgi:dimethylargininase